MNAELIKALQYCLSDDYVKRGCCKCPINKDGMVCGTQDDAIKYAANALEAADKRIAELELILKAVQENSDINFRLWQEAEAQLPKEGEWIEDEYGYIHCSRCGMEWDEPEHPNTNYCPNCGARMKGKETDDGIHVRE